MTPRYLIAQYTSDVFRREPRNVGIIVWSPDGACARFIGERADRTVDGRTLPVYIRSTSTYKQWVHYWRSQLQKEQIHFAHSSDTAVRTEPMFLEALQSSSKGNFALVEGGTLLDAVLPSGLQELCDFLFNLLVSDRPIEESIDVDLVRVSDETIGKAGLKQDPCFKMTGVEVICQLDDVIDRFQFSYAYARDDENLALLQRVSFPNSTAVLEKNLHAALWQFQSVVSAKKIPFENLYALVYLPPDRFEEELVTQSYKHLTRRAGKVVNLFKEAESVVQLEQLKILTAA